MPIYEFACPKGHKFDRFLKLANYKEIQTCECGTEAIKLISTPMIAPTFEAYESPIDGSPITSKRKRIEDLARSDCVPYEEGMVEENNRRMKNHELKLEKAMDETVEDTIVNMPARKKEKLESEMKSDINIEYGRVK